MATHQHACGMSPIAKDTPYYYNMVYFLGGLPIQKLNNSFASEMRPAIVEVCPMIFPMIRKTLLAMITVVFFSCASLAYIN